MSNMFKSDSDKVQEHSSQISINANSADFVYNMQNSMTNLTVMLNMTTLVSEANACMTEYDELRNKDASAINNIQDTYIRLDKEISDSM